MPHFVLFFSLFLSLSSAQASPQEVLSHCFNAPPNCTSYECLANSRSEDIRSLSSLQCSHNNECFPERTGLYCRDFSSGSFCDCPIGYAYDPSECGCKQAEPCSGPFCHNEMKCPNRRCSCSEGELGVDLLFEPHARLCVYRRKSSENVFMEYFHPEEFQGGSSLSGVAIALIVLSALVFIAIVSSLFIRDCFGLSGSFTCKKGDYECEEDPFPGGGEAPLRRNDVHVAAWDLPSLDYLTEEEAALKYIKKERRSPDEGSSLPECEQSHINAGYISDNN